MKKYEYYIIFTYKKYIIFNKTQCSVCMARKVCIISYEIIFIRYKVILFTHQFQVYRRPNSQGPLTFTSHASIATE